VLLLRTPDDAARLEEAAHRLVDVRAALQVRTEAAKAEDAELRQRLMEYLVLEGSFHAYRGDIEAAVTRAHHVLEHEPEHEEANLLLSALGREPPAAEPKAPR
jgi:hypothetical protein